MESIHVEMKARRWLLLALTLMSLCGQAQIVDPFKGGLYDILMVRLNEHSLPLVNIVVDPSTLHTTSFVPGEIEITDWHRRTNPEQFTVRYRCKYRIRGGTSTAFDKKSFAVKLVDDNGEDMNANLFGIREDNSWILDAMAVDRTRMRNRVCFDVWNDLSVTPYDTDFNGRNGTEGIFVEVFINKEYNGIYCLTDKINRKLLDLKKAQVDEEGNVTTRGVLYKGEKWGDYTDIWLLGYEEADTDTTAWNAWELQYPDDYPSQEAWQPLMDLIDFCSEATSDEEFLEAYQDWFYADNLADYALFTMAMNVGDNAYKNTFLSVKNINKGHCFLLTPWDMDMSLGGSWNGAIDSSLVSIRRYNGVAPYNRLISRNLDNFKQLLASKWEEYGETLFSYDAIARRLDDYAELFTISGAWKRECNKWNGNPVPLQPNITDELAYVKRWYEKNHESLCEQVDLSITTAIKDVERSTFNIERSATSEAAKPSATFNLLGQRISILQKGIVVVNGKKIVVVKPNKRSLY